MRTSPGTRLASVALAAVLGLAGCADYVGDDVRADGTTLARTPDPVAIDGSTTTTTLASTPVDPRTLPDGACFDDPADADGRQPSTPAVVDAGAVVVPRDCAAEHRYEIFARGDLATPETPWPGAAPVAELTDTFCTPQFERFVGAAWASSALDFVSLVPDEAAWAAGQRGAVCIVIDVGLAPLTGSAAGAGS